ncbi:MAG: ABC transporter permease subunit [Halobacteriota archaeon]
MRPVLEIARYEGRRRVRGTAVFAIGIAALVGLIFMIWPEMADLNLDELLEAYPPVLRELLGVETFSTIEGFLATEIYNFVWVLLLGLYFAYSAAGTIAGDVETERMDLLLAMPLTRARVLLEKVASLAVPMVGLNVAIAIVVFVGAVAVGETIDPVDLAMVHALSVPYFATCAAIGIVLSVSFDRADVANRAALGIVFALWLVESIVALSETFDWIGQLSPVRYYDPSAILVHGEYDLLGAATLVVATAMLLVVAIWLFRRGDVGA